MRLLHLQFSHLPLRLARERWAGPGPFPDGPLLLHGPGGLDARVLDADPAARALGIRPGMLVTSAGYLAPEVIGLEADLGACQAALGAAFERLAGFSPGLVGPRDPAAPGFGRLEVQLDGLERLWGPEPILVAKIGQALAALLPGRPLAGVAGTRFAAALAARASGDGRSGRAGRGATSGPLTACIVSPGAEATFLAPRPAAFLTADPEVRARLARYGLTRIGQVAELSRSALVARFGEAGGRLHARARGEETDPFRPDRLLERLALALPLDPPAESVEPLRFVLHRLTGALSDQLAARGQAAGRARLRLEIDPAFAPAGTPATVVQDQPLPESTADAMAIERLLLARLERTPPSAPVERLELELAEIGPAAGRQLAAFTPDPVQGWRVGWSLARLALRFGGRVGHYELVDPDSLLVEDRSHWQPVESGAVADPGHASGASGSVRR